MDGPGAVLVFFVLSGLVLSTPFIREDHQPFFPFIIKRVARIWAPFAVAILMSAALQALMQPTSIKEYSIWFNGSWSKAITPQLLLRHLILVNGVETELDGPMWSLVHEMRVSLVFPIIVFCTIRKPTATMLASIVLFVPIRLIGLHHGPVATQAVQTAASLFLFVTGSIIGVRLTFCRAFIANLSTPAHWLGLVSAAALLVTAPFLNEVPESLRQCMTLLASGAGAIVIVAFCVHENLVTRFLETSIPSWLGRVSYSLYLIHVPILLTVFHLLPGVTFPLKFILAVTIALIASEPFHRLVERPSMALGRRLAGALGPQRALSRQGA